MSDVIDRINTLLKLENLTRDQLTDLTGAKKDRWPNVLKGKAKPYVEDLEGLYRVWPEYAYWLATGMELPEAGQISPLTKKATELLKPARQAGE
jgi:hypothetical protein